VVDEGGDAGGTVSRVVDGLRREPAYLLVFGLALLLTAGAFASRLNAWQATLVAAGAFVLAGFAIWLVEQGKQRSLPVHSEEQKQRLMPLPDQELAARDVLEGLVDNGSDTYFVYSSTKVDGFVDGEGRPIEYPFGEEELRVTAIPDAHGIGKVHTMLNLAGKRERLHVVTSPIFRPEYWEDDLILIGSPNANQQTAVALARLGSPFRFAEGVTAIEEVSGDARWPPDPEDLEERDFALLAKLKRRSGGEDHVCLVLAGIGGLGTLAACHYLYRHVLDLHGRFGSSPFACILSLIRDEGYTQVKEETGTKVSVVES
jgi:hypothetical protein